MDTRQQENLVGFNQLPEQAGAAHLRTSLGRSIFNGYSKGFPDGTSSGLVRYCIALGGGVTKGLVALRSEILLNPPDRLHGPPPGEVNWGTSIKEAQKC